MMQVMMVRLFLYSNLLHVIDFCIHLAKTVHCLEILLIELKPKRIKDTVKSIMGAIICFADVSFFLPLHMKLKIKLLSPKCTEY